METTQNRFVINSNLNLPAIKFHRLNNKTVNSHGSLEFFSSVGVGISIKYGKTTILYETNNKKVLKNKPEFSNLYGLQIDILYSSNLNDDQEANNNQFAIYGGINILDIQIGYGFELGQQLADHRGSFFCISYGIPLHKLTSNTSYMIRRKKKLVFHTLLQLINH